MPLEITTLAFVATVADIVHERGADFVYKRPRGTETAKGGETLVSRCSYVKSGNSVSCRCLIGEVAHRLGVSDEELATWDQAGGATTLIWETRQILCNVECGNLIAYAQRRQDNGAAYGDILRDFDTYLDIISANSRDNQV